MKRKSWAPGDKLAIFLEDLKERRSVVEMCGEHQMSWALDHLGREKFL